VRVEIRGNDRSLSAAAEEDISAIADFSRFTSEGVYTTPIVIQKKGVLEGLDTIEIRVDPLEITLPVEKKVRRRVEVVPVFKGLPATGYRLEQYSVNPSGVDLEGPQGIVQNIAAISTEDIDLAGKREAFNVRVRLVSENPLVTFPGGETVDFRGQILESLELKTFEAVELTFQGLDPGLLISEEAPRGWITLQGGQGGFESLKKDRPQLIVNCEGLTEAGAYTLPVKPLVPQGLSVVQFSPDHITLVIGRGGRVNFQ
jgi:hypothetical protein